jgi:hypothetical protein
MQTTSRDVGPKLSRCLCSRQALGSRLSFLTVLIPVVFALGVVLHRSYVITTAICRERKMADYKSSAGYIGHSNSKISLIPYFRQRRKHLRVSGRL